MALSPKQRAARYRQKHPARARESVRDSLRRKRAAEREAKREVVSWPDPPADPGAALCEWARETLIVPPGHPKAGERFELPAYLAAFFADALAVDTHEAALIIARKNGKSSSVAALLACFMVGCLRRPGFRVGVASINREKSFELKEQIRALKEAANLGGLQVWRRGAQGVTGPGGSSIDFVSADKNAGAASSWDIAVCDEIGLRNYCSCRAAGEFRHHAHGPMAQTADTARIGFRRSRFFWCTPHREVPGAASGSRGGR